MTLIFRLAKHLVTGATFQARLIRIRFVSLRSALLGSCAFCPVRPPRRLTTPLHERRLSFFSAVLLVGLKLVSTCTACRVASAAVGSLSIPYWACHFDKLLSVKRHVKSFCLNPQ